MASKRYSRGRRARSVCDRGGHEFPYRYLVIEPGTGLRVDRRWSDGRWNSVDHPQNFPPRHLNDEAPLRYPTSEDLPCTLEELTDENGAILVDENGAEIATFCESEDLTLILTDNSGNALTDDSSNELSGVFSKKFTLSYGTI